MSERYIGRSHTWIAETADRAIYIERDYGSLRAIPQESPVIRLGLVATHDEAEASQHYSVLIPPDATPVCFWRVSLTIETGERSAITVIGWERAGSRSLLWVFGDGSCLLTDRDLDEPYDVPEGDDPHV